jgi:hypothetical protein
MEALEYEQRGIRQFGLAAIGAYGEEEPSQIALVRASNSRRVQRFYSNHVPYSVVRRSCHEDPRSRLLRNLSRVSVKAVSFQLFLLVLHFVCCAEKALQGRYLGAG